MRVRFDVRVHAHGDGRDFFQARSHAVDAFQFRFALGVERINAFFECELDFRLGFAHAGKNAFTRIAARGNHALQLTTADDVETAAEIREYAQYGEVGIGLHRETHEVVQR